MITVLELAEYRGAKEPFTGSELERVGLQLLGGCEICGTSIAAYNAFPAKSGFWRCSDCLYGEGWNDVAQANLDIFDYQ